MDKTKPFTVDEAHEYLAKSFNGRVWELLQKLSHAHAEDD